MKSKKRELSIKKITVVDLQRPDLGAVKGGIFDSMIATACTCGITMCGIPC